MRTVMVLLLASTLVFAKHPKIAKDLDNADPSSTVNVIVQFTHPPAQAQHQKVRDKGGVHRSSLPLVRAGLYSIPAARLAELADDPEVAYISPDRTVTAAGTGASVSASAFLSDYKLQAVNADIAQKYGFSGSGIGVAVIDSGIQDKTDFHGGYNSRIVYSQSFVAGSSASDQYGHGTHVAGLVAGNGSQSQGAYAGVATNANLINLRVLDQNGSGTDSLVIAALQQAIQLKWRYNIRVINLSLGRAVFESYKVDPLCQAVEAAWNAGIVVVVAAGNNGRNNSWNTSGYATINAPGNDPYAITVGSMTTHWTQSKSDDTIDSYSSKGPTLFDHVVKPDLVAPGNRLVSVLDNGTLSRQYPGNVFDANYFILSGTSMATGMVSGAAALLLQENSSLTPDQIKARLMKTANKNFPTTSIATDPTTGLSYTSEYDVFTIGAGYLDVWAALNNFDVVPNGMLALSPSAVYNSATGQTSLAYSNSLVWGDAVLWGTGLVWGDIVLVPGTDQLTGGYVVWGSSTVTGFGLVWGDAVLWGSSTQTAVESLSVAINGEN